MRRKSEICQRWRGGRKGRTRLVSAQVESGTYRGSARRIMGVKDAAFLLRGTALAAASAARRPPRSPGLLPPLTSSTLACTFIACLRDKHYGTGLLNP